MDSNHQIICKLVYKRTFLPTLNSRPVCVGTLWVEAMVWAAWACTGGSSVPIRGGDAVFFPSLPLTGESGEVRDRTRCSDDSCPKLQEWRDRAIANYDAEKSLVSLAPFLDIL